MTLLISLNVERSKHLDRFVPFLSRMRPDVACLQELVADDLPAIQSATGLSHAHFVPMAIHPSDGLSFGVGILARQPFVATETVTYAGVGDGTMAFDRTTPESRLQSCRYVAACAHLSFDGNEMQIATTHFPWTPDGGPRPFQSDAVRSLIDGFHDRSVILTGDFNAPRGGPIFAELAAVWRDWVPAEVTTSLDPHLHRAGPLELMVDGLFATPDYRISDVRLHTAVSDHQAISAHVGRAPA